MKMKFICLDAEELHVWQRSKERKRKSKRYTEAERKQKREGENRQSKHTKCKMMLISQTGLQ